MAQRERASVVGLCLAELVLRSVPARASHAPEGPSSSRSRESCFRASKTLQKEDVPR